MSEQVSDFRFGHRKWPFWEWEKATFTAFPHSRKGPSGAQNENLRPVLTLGLWRGYVVRNSLTFGHWKVVFSLFLILYRAFSHFMYPTFCQFRKRKMVQSWFQKVFWNKDCDVFGNLVVEIKNFNFCLFVCLFVCLYLTFCQFRKWKMVQSWFQKLFWNQGCDAVLNLAVEFWIWNFYLFHYTLIYNLKTV